MTSRAVDTEALLTLAGVAQLFRVDPKTVTWWANAGKLTWLRTLGGHRCYREFEVRNFLDEAVSPFLTRGRSLPGAGCRTGWACGQHWRV